VHIPICYKAETALSQREIDETIALGKPLRALYPLPKPYAIAWVRNAIERSWNTVSNVRFEEFVECPANCDKRYSVLMLGAAPAVPSGPTGLRIPHRFALF
jgi:hypothetical protein